MDSWALLHWEYCFFWVWHVMKHINTLPCQICMALSGLTRVLHLSLPDNRLFLPLSLCHTSTLGAEQKAFVVCRFLFSCDLANIHSKRVSRSHGAPFDVLTFAYCEVWK